MTTEEFWPFYISQHSRKITRQLHLAGTTLGLVNLILSGLLLRPGFILLGLVTAYALAWIGHFFFEKNKPATFKYPLLSFRADFKMYALMWRGKMDQEIARLGTNPQPIP